MSKSKARRSGPPPEPGIVVVDKPAGMTSHDVVSRCRRAFATRKVGHAGTLDPAATGVLLIGIERATKLLGHLSLTTKTYETTIRLGALTSTDDAEGETLTSAPAGHLRREDLDAPVAALTGEIMQRPAAVSAIKIAGKRAYERVRSGEDVEIPARPVTVHRFEIVDVRPGADGADVLDVDAVVDCSSGTYIRSLARDLGEALGVGGHLTALRRTRVGDFGLSVARTLDQLAEHAEVSISLDDAVLDCFPHRPVTAEEAIGLAHGKWLEPVGEKATVAAVDPEGVPVALLRESGSRAAPVFLVRPQ
ncbi:tRNA pseudouridine(55) synthase TruB [Dietzia sp.]|uniref:tRNA pseudouridine(55) synthase TruB n=1 Tax=Dietzia sp. TaxID=1871616 RepID=UPI002FD8BB14